MNAPALRLTVSFRDTLSLAQAWMPFIRNGALFVPTQERATIGDAAFVLVSLDALQQRHAITGTVVWVSPASPEAGSQTGVGIQLGDDEISRKLVSQIADSLGNIQVSLKKTATL